MLPPSLTPPLLSLSRTLGGNGATVTLSTPSPTPSLVPKECPKVVHVGGVGQPPRSKRRCCTYLLREGHVKSFMVVSERRCVTVRKVMDTALKVMEGETPTPTVKLKSLPLL